LEGAYDTPYFQKGVENSPIKQYQLLTGMSIVKSQPAVEGQGAYDN